ncbi:MAG TPA: hypothetical protein DIU10_17525, partial [Sulfitobacter sp.]|nr:hypothetical protein [Sulfitobacter sp.]
GRRRRFTTKEEIKAIFEATPACFADDKRVVNGDRYTRAYRDNLLRIYRATEIVDQEADAHVLDRARRGGYWLMRELLAQCEVTSARAFNAVLRHVGQGVIKANLHAVICEYSRIWLA